jgi:CO/xanthine dehydrogenase Mo-binding subunit
MLAGLVEREKVINHLYGEMPKTQNLRDRHPQPVEWSQAKALMKELDYPCKVVVKAQDQGHWYLSYAMHRMVALYKHLLDGLLELEATRGL